MILLNLAHPLTPAQLERIRQWTGEEVEVRSLPAQFDPQQPLAPQAQALVEKIGLTPEQWQTLPLLLNPPGHSGLALAVLAELHGRMGYFPSILRLRPALGEVATLFEAAEILNLQQIRDTARQHR